MNVLPVEEKSGLIQLFDSIIPDGIATNMLVLDETLYISKKKYGISYNDTIEFWQNTVIPTTIVLDMGQDTFTHLSKIISSHNLKPSDAFHLATMYQYDIPIIISEDDDFDNIENISREWI